MVRSHQQSPLRFQVNASCGQVSLVPHRTRVSAELDGATLSNIRITTYGALAVRLFDEDGDLAVEEQRCSVGVLEHVRLLADHEIAGVVEVIKQVAVGGAAADEDFLVQRRLAL